MKDIRNDGVLRLFDFCVFYFENQNIILCKNDCKFTLELEWLLRESSLDTILSI